MSGRRCGARQRNQKCFLFAIQFAGRTGARFFLQSKIETAHDKPFTHSFDGGNARLERIGNLLIGLFVVRHLQNVSARETPCGDATFVRQPFQCALLIIGQCDNVFFRHGDLPSYDAVYS